MMKLKEEEVYDMNYINALNWMSFFQEKNRVEQQQMKKNKR